MVLKNQLLAKASEAARAGNVPALSAISARAAECERLIAEAQDLDERFSSLSSYLHTPSEKLALYDGPPPPSTARPRFAKRDGAEMRAQWIADMKAKGVQLQGYGKRYTTAFGATVGLASANELDGHLNKWFLGMADEPTDVVVLLCRSRSGKVYDIVLPVPALGRCWAFLSRSGSQVKFNVRKDVAVFLLLVPGNEPLDVTQYLSHYEPLVISHSKSVNSTLTTNSSPTMEPSMTIFGQKKYSVQGVYEMIVSNGGEMYLNDIYREIERSGELTVHDENDNTTGATRYKHNVRGYLQQLKRDGRVENVSHGLWRACTR